MMEYCGYSNFYQTPDFAIVVYSFLTTIFLILGIIALIKYILERS